MNRVAKLITIVAFLFAFPQNGISKKNTELLAGQPLIDSLLKELPKAKEDTLKAGLLNCLAAATITADLDKSMGYARQELDLATRLNWKKGIACAKNDLGSILLARNDRANALQDMQDALALYQEIGYKKGIAKVTGNIGGYYMYICDFRKGLEYNTRQLQLFEELGDKAGTAIALGNIGLGYFTLSDFSKAIDFYVKSLKISEEIGDKTGVATMRWQIGQIYQAQSRYPEAEENYFQALKLFQETANHRNESMIDGDIGGVYEMTGEHALAMTYFTKALQLGEEYKDKYAIALANESIGNAYVDRHDYDKALDYLLQALKLQDELGDKNGILSGTMAIGAIYSSQHNYILALQFLKKSLEMAGQVGDKRQYSIAEADIGSALVDLVNDTSVLRGNIKGNGELLTAKYKLDNNIPASRPARLRMAIDYLQRSIAQAQELSTPDALMEAYQHLSLAYKLTGDYRAAFEYGDRYNKLKDSVFSKDNNEKMIKLSMKNEYDTKRLADSLRAVEKEKLTSLELKRQRSYTIIGLMGVLLLAGFSYFILKERGRSEAERKKSDDLLLNILPYEVAGELKRTGTASVRHYDNITVLFTDFVDFTNAGERMSPQALIEELHTCFKAFDEITHKHRIEKIKTIGDAYLAVAGLPVPDPRHAEHVIQAAIEIRDFMDERYGKLGNKTFEVRIGIHSGSVVAGIVGVKKFSYDIWGDTVNTAARMEQNSEPGKINISETTYDLIKDRFTCIHRGEINAKNKGMLNMYFVTSTEAPLRQFT